MCLYIYIYISFVLTTGDQSWRTGGEPTRNGGTHLHSSTKRPTFTRYLATKTFVASLVCQQRFHGTSSSSSPLDKTLLRLAKRGIKHINKSSRKKKALTVLHSDRVASAPSDVWLVSPATHRPLYPLQQWKAPNRPHQDLEIVYCKSKTYDYFSFFVRGVMNVGGGVFVPIASVSVFFFLR